tara:strand:+ start:378 stop:527 length:150 start_codon:yes stop_codon:yes gene_type:complete
MNTLADEDDEDGKSDIIGKVNSRKKIKKISSTLPDSAVKTRCKSYDEPQ